MNLRYWFDFTLCKLVKIPLWLLFHSYFQVTYYGKQNILKKGPLLVACHHESFLDPILAGFGFSRILCYMARDSLFRPPLKWLIDHVFAYPINRDGSDLGAFKTARELLKRNFAVLVFPEGTRSSDGRVGSFKAGIGLIAMRNNVPILPVYIHGAFHCWPRTRKFPRPGQIQVYFDTPLMPDFFKDLSKNREGFQKITLELEKRVKNLEKMAIL